MRYVFLDVDGPLNNLYTHESIRDIDASKVSSDAVYEIERGILWLICPWMLDNLYDVLTAYDDVKLIGISSWFCGGIRCRGVEIFEELTGLHIDGVIDYTGGGEYRFTCAENYANVHGVEKYVIIDDLQYDHKKLVRIEREGLTQEKAIEAIRMMK